MVRAAVMNMLSTRLPGCHWLDLCSGSGVMGCEAIQRGVRRVVAVERDRATAAVCRNNLIATAEGLDPAPDISVICTDLKRWLARGRPVGEPGFDLVYFDPPYAADLYDTGLRGLQSGDWLRPEALVICEHARNTIPEPPEGWQLRDQRWYGSSGLLLISPPGRCPGGTDSRPPQTNQEG